MTNIELIEAIVANVRMEKTNAQGEINYPAFAGALYAMLTAIAMFGLDRWLQLRTAVLGDALSDQDSSHQSC